jgi:hypothetical protein
MPPPSAVAVTVVTLAASASAMLPDRLLWSRVSVPELMAARVSAKVKITAGH